MKVENTFAIWKIKLSANIEGRVTQIKERQHFFILHLDQYLYLYIIYTYMAIYEGDRGHIFFGQFCL